MLKILILFGFFFVGKNCVLLRDPKMNACEDYDLFDPVRRVVTESSNIVTEADYENLAQEAVHQLNARSNSLFKSMLIRLKSFTKTDNGKIHLNVHQMESRCRNNRQVAVSLVKCPLKENGMIQECNLIVNIPTESNPRVRLEKFTCRPARLEDVLGFTTEVSAMSSGSLDFLTRNITLIGFRAPTLDNFKCFVSRYAKVYKNNEERANRFVQFQANMKLAYLLQATEQGSGIYGPSKFSDLSASEFRKLSTGLLPNRPSRPMRRGPIPQLDADDLPAAFDWRNQSAVTPVKDQGQCGSCWAFSTTGNIEGQWAVKKGKLLSLSEQELVDCDKLDEGCGGGLPSNAYQEIIRLGGLETEGDYPYDGKNDQCSFKKPVAKVYINDSVSVSTNETDMAKWLVQNGPISIGINANAMMLYMGGVSHPWKVLCSPKNLDHGVLIVGYDVDDKRKPYWIVKNSWGAHWGVKGYYLVYRGDGTCGLNLMCTSAIVA